MQEEESSCGEIDIKISTGEKDDTKEKDFSVVATKKNTKLKS